MVVYLIGSLRNPKIVEIGNVLREAGYDCFEDWHAGGPEADDEWQRYETQRGRSYKQALAGYHAAHIFHYDLHHLDRADVGVLIAPAGKSAHLELGYLIGHGKPGYMLFEQDPERWDVMALFATQVCFSLQELIEALRTYESGASRRTVDQPDTPERRTVDHAGWDS